MGVALTDGWTPTVLPRFGSMMSEHRIARKNEESPGGPPHFATQTHPAKIGGNSAGGAQKVLSRTFDPLSHNAKIPRGEPRRQGRAHGTAQPGSLEKRPSAYGNDRLLEEILKFQISSKCLEQCLNMAARGGRGNCLVKLLKLCTAHYNLTPTLHLIC